jgi:type IV pilus assembly protein PilV
MQLTSITPRLRRQIGSSLIEVLVAVLILSLGMLALGGMLSYAVQLPKLAGYRASAMTIAAGHIDRMRANTAGYIAGGYTTASTSYNAVLPVVTQCVYPLCQPADIATLDKDETNRALRRELPGNSAGIFLSCTGNCSLLEGSLWVVWDEPSTVSALNASASDECPPGLTGAITSSPPRCLLIRFKL